MSDLKVIRKYIALNSQRSADNVISRIRQAVLIFEAFPMLGHKGRIADTREFPVPGLPYTIIYSLVSDTELDVLTILHQSLQYPPDDDPE